MARYTKHRELQQSIDGLRLELTVWRAVVLDCLRVAAGLTDEEVEQLRLRPPFELLEKLITQDVERARLNAWWVEMVRVVTDPPEKRICASCGERYDGVWE